MTESNVAENEKRNDDSDVLTAREFEKEEEKATRRAPLYVVPQACRWVLRGGKWVCI